MRENRSLTLPIIGRIQHGEQITTNGVTRAKELGHFIAKVQDDFMQKFLQKFDETCKGKKFIEIEFFNDTPLTKKYVRYNQSGDVCHCVEGLTTGSQKTKNGWKPIECSTEQCQYRQKNENGKTACNRIGWLKFFIPSICKDRIWLMRITSQTSINRIDDYITLQKIMGNPLKGRYILFLKQEEQEKKSTGQKFNNYVLDILRKEDFIQTNQIPQKTEKPKDSSTKHPQNVNKSVSKQEKTEITEKATTPATPSNEKEQKGTTKKATKNKDKKAETKANDKNETSVKATEFTNHYILESTFTEKITNKNGEEKEYLIGKFYDTNDNACEIVIKPEDAEELKKCELGTLVELMIKEVAERKFAIDLKYINKLIKNVAA